MNPLAAALCLGEVLLLQGCPKLANGLKQQGMRGLKTNLVLQNTLCLKETACLQFMPSFTGIAEVTLFWSERPHVIPERRSCFRTALCITDLRPASGFSSPHGSKPAALLRCTHELRNVCIIPWQLQLSLLLFSITSLSVR